MICKIRILKISSILFLLLCFNISILCAKPHLIVNPLRNNSDFKEKCWDISREFTKDLKKSLLKEFSLTTSTGEILSSIIVYGNIKEFDITSKEYSAMPLVGQRFYVAKIVVELYLSSATSCSVTKIISEQEKTYNKITGFFTLPEEEDEINTRMADFSKRDKIKWGSEEFNKSILGKARDEAIRDLTEKVVKKLKQ
ncbi:MAG: hypothetical protein A2252_06890 [Elusimicrobia bacterium RIFOXYA2_FULL_39_19]|nr:MAG: hypothetical protein A2252_06890 [Elusimicrobia bacterium RIFOXYA2_FULL_39_19]